MTDTIVYKVVTKGGGMDGMDNTDKGGKVMGAAISRETIPAKYRVAAWYAVVPEVVDLEAVASAALAKLNPVEKLALQTLRNLKP